MTIDKRASSLIFLPGWGFPASMWRNMSSLRKKDYPSYRLTFVELSEALSAESFPANAVLVGWSLGGLIAIKHCLRHPRRYQKLILINSAPYFSKFTVRYKNLAENNFSHFKKMFLRWVCYPDSVNPLLCEGQFKNGDELLAQLSFLFETNYQAEFEKIDLPVLRIQGSSDAIVSHDIWPDRANHTVKIITGGHALPFTHENEVSALIKAFL